MTADGADYFSKFKSHLKNLKMKSSNKINILKVIIVALFISQLFIPNILSAQNVLTYNSPFAVQKVTGGLDTADIDGDGDLDILYSGNHGQDAIGQTTIHLYKNDGSGNFTEVTTHPFSPIYVGDIKFADVDGDNDQDVLIVGLAFHLAIGLIGPSARLYLNDGTGNFTYQSGTPFVANQRCEIAFADVDNDNDLDVCIVGPYSSALYTNNGLGSFTLSTTFSTLTNGRVVFGDVNGDNHKDLLISGENSSNIYVTELYTNNGSGTFTLVNGTPFTGISEGQLIIKDIDGDNDNDVLVTGESASGIGFTGLYWNDGSGNFTLDNNTTFTATYNGSNLMLGGSSALIEDFDGDSDMDIMIPDYYPSQQGKTRIYINDGTNKFHRMSNIWMPYRHAAYDIAYGDIDGDGIKDFIVNGIAGASSSGFTGWYKNTYLSKANKAIDFDGTNIFTAQHFTILNTTPLNTIPMTIEFWAKIPIADTDIGLIKKTDGANDGFEIYTSSGTLHAKYSKDASNHVAVQSSSTVNDDTWHHIAFTVDNANANLYIDGILIQTTAWIGTAGNITNTKNLIFGQGTNNYNGLLDEVRIWNTARTASQIRENMYGEFAKPTDETNLIANYTMDVYSDSLIMDVSQYYNRAAISGGSVTLVDELVNYSNATSTTNTGIQNTTVTIGKITFDDETANGNNAYDAPIQIVVTEVTGAPNVTTGIMEANIDNRYYIVQSFDGAGTFAADVSIDCSGCTNGQSVSLYGRNHGSTGNWALFTIGTVTGGKAVFQNIPFFSQLIIASAVSLPVELLSFKATAENNHVRLDWSVGVEENLSHYEIEKSENGVDFVSIGLVSAKGLSFYKFEDYDIIQNNKYYRLKAVDIDGSFEYSNILNIEYRTRNNEYRIFPNPVSDILNVETTAPTTIQIANINGQIVKEIFIHSTSTIAVDDLPAGTYFLKMGSEVRKIIIQK